VLRFRDHLHATWLHEVLPGVDYDHPGSAREVGLQGNIREEQSKQLKTEFTDQKKETCRICSKQFTIVNLAIHSNYCKDQRSIESELLDIKKELGKMLPEIGKLKNKMKFEAILYTKEKKKDDLNASLFSERASVGGGHGLKFNQPSDLPKRTGMLKKSETLNISEDDHFEPCLTSSQMISPIRAPFDGANYKGVVAIQEYPDEEQTPLRSPTKRRNTSGVLKDPESFMDSKPYGRSFSNLADMKCIKRSSTDLRESIAKDEFMMGVETASLIPPLKFDCNDSMIEEFAKIGLQTGHLDKKESLQDASRNEYLSPIEPKNKAIPGGAAGGAGGREVGLSKSLLDSNSRVQGGQRFETAFNNILIEDVNKSLSDLGSHLESNSSRKASMAGNESARKCKSKFPEQRPTTRVDLDQPEDLKVDIPTKMMSERLVSGPYAALSTNKFAFSQACKKIGIGNQALPTGIYQRRILNMGSVKMPTMPGSGDIGEHPDSFSKPDRQGDDRNLNTDRRYRDSDETSIRRQDEREMKTGAALNKIIEFLTSFDSYCRGLNKDQTNIQCDKDMESKAIMFLDFFTKSENKADVSFALTVAGSMMDRHGAGDNKIASMNYKAVEDAGEFDYTVLKYLKDVIPIFNLVVESTAKRTVLLGKLRNIEKNLAHHEDSVASNLNSQKANMLAKTTGGTRTILYNSFRLKRNAATGGVPLPLEVQQAIEEDENEYRPSFRSNIDGVEGQNREAIEKESPQSEGYIDNFGVESGSYGIDSPDRLVDQSFEISKERLNSYRSENIAGREGNDSSSHKVDLLQTTLRNQKGRSQVEMQGFKASGYEMDELGSNFAPDEIKKPDAQLEGFQKVLSNSELSKKNITNSIISLPNHSDKTPEICSEENRSQGPTHNRDQSLPQTVIPRSNSILGQLQLKRTGGTSSNELGTGLLGLVKPGSVAKNEELIYPTIWKPHKFVPGMAIEGNPKPKTSRWGQQQKTQSSSFSQQSSQFSGSEEQEEEEIQSMDGNGYEYEVQDVEQYYDEEINHETEEREKSELEEEEAISQQEEDIEENEENEIIEDCEEDHGNEETQQENLEIEENEASGDFNNHKSLDDNVEKGSGDAQQFSRSGSRSKHQTLQKMLSPIPENSNERAPPSYQDASRILVLKPIELPSSHDLQHQPHFMDMFAGSITSSALTPTHTKLDDLDSKQGDSLFDLKAHQIKKKLKGDLRNRNFTATNDIKFVSQLREGNETTLPDSRTNDFDYKRDVDPRYPSLENIGMLSKLPEEEQMKRRIDYEKVRNARNFVDVSKSDYVRLVKSDSELDHHLMTDIFQELSPAVALDSFEFIKKLGQGAYGIVYLVKKKATSDFYAMKMIRFPTELDSQFIENVKNENAIFQVVEDKFVVTALFTFIHKNYICFAMEWMRGGDLAHLLVENTYFEQDFVQMYAAQLVLAIDYLHKKGVVHRDLKPDNILIDIKGNLKLTDFGLSGIKQKVKELGKGVKQEEDQSTFAETFLPRNSCHEGQSSSRGRLSTSIRRTKGYILPSMCARRERKDFESVLGSQIDDEMGEIHIIGTPDYIAPEVLRGTVEESLVFAVDWWALGIILYELLCGIPPFNDDTKEKVFANIRIGKIEWPEIGN
jgi:serine/threonine protein kinase